MEPIPYKKDVIIIKKGDKNNKSLYLIKKGFVSCCLNGKDTRILKENTAFGILALILEQERTLDVIIWEDDTLFFKWLEKLLLIILKLIILMLFSIYKNVVMHKLFLYDIINDDNIYNDLFKFLKIIQKKI